MIDEPVVKASLICMNPNSWLDQSTSSSAIRERCTEQIASALTASSRKSRLPTASSELSMGRSKPSASAVAARSIGNVVPARAALPRGDSFMRFAASTRRPLSRSSISAHAKR
jgi:hypothetical protein